MYNFPFQDKSYSSKNILTSFMMNYFIFTF
jgi:hypothetical protein